MRTSRLVVLLVPLLVVALVWLCVALVLDDESPTGPGGGSVPAAPGAGTATGDTAARRPTTRTHRPATVTGEVRLAQDGSPATGIAVTLTRDGAPAADAASGPDGRFTLTGLPAGEGYALAVEVSGYAPVHLAGLELRSGETRDVGQLLLAPGVRARVRVWSSVNLPLPDARVAAYRLPAYASTFEGDAPVAVAQGVCGADGVAVFEGLATGTWAFVATHPGHARRGETGVELGLFEVERTIDIHLDRGYALAGTVVDERRAPIAGARVLAVARGLSSDSATAPLGQRTTAGPDGRFRFEGIPGADMIVWAGRPGAPMAIALAVRVPDVTDVDVVLAGGGRIEGRVTGKDGTPVDDARVTISMSVLRGFPIEVPATTEADGTFTVELPMEGTVDSVGATKPGWSEGYDPRFNSGTQVARTGLVHTAEIELNPSVLIRGRVTGPRGPLGGATLYAGTDAGLVTESADENGEYTLSPPTGAKWAVIWATHDAHAMPGLSAEETELPQGWSENAPITRHAELRMELPLPPGVVERDFVLEARTAESVTDVHGVVIEQGTRTGVADAWVSGEGVRQVRTGADGSFELKGVPRRSDLSVGTNHPDFTSVWIDLDTSAGPPESPVELPVTRRPRVAGVVLRPDGSPAQNAYVQIVDPPDDRVDDEWSWVDNARLPVGADGRFEHPLPDDSGTYVVRAVAPGFARTNSAPLHLTPGTPRYDVSITLAEGAGLEGHVDDESGAPVAFAQVSLLPLPGESRPEDVGYPGAWGPPVSAVTDASGTFLMKALSPGRYAVKAWATGALPTTVVVHIPEEATVHLTLQGARMIAGHVVFADGTPAKGVLMHATTDADRGSSDEPTTRSGLDGSFAFQGLPSAPHDVSVVPDRAGDNVLSSTSRGVEAGTTDLRMVVERGLEVSGVVLLPDGVPVAYAEVFITHGAGDEGDEQDSTGTEQGGRFRFVGLTSGSVRVFVRNVNDYEGLDVFPGPTVAAGTRDVRVTLPGLGSLTGVLVDDAGEPLQGAHVNAIPESAAQGNAAVRAEDMTLQVDDDGRFEFRAPQGARYRFQVAYAPRPAVLLESPVGVVGGPAVRLQAGVGLTLGGVVRDRGGKSVVNASVGVYSDDWGFARSGQTGEDGRFEIAGLKPGTCHVQVAAAGFADAQVDAESGTSDTAVVLEPTVATGGVVYDRDGHPVANANVMLQPTARAGVSYQSSTGEDGRFSFNDMPEGEYQVHVYRDGWDDWRPSGTVRAGRTDLRIDIDSQ